MKHRFQWLLIGSFAFAAAACNRDKPAEPAPPVVAPAEAPANAPAAPTSRVRYIERMTGGAKTSDAVPMIVAIHGLGDRPESFGGIFDGFSARARLILPYGLTSYGDGFSWFPISRMDPKLLADGTKQAADELASLLGELTKSRPVKGKPIVTGFSQGGMLSFTLAVLHADHVGEALPIAGLLAPPLYPSAWPMGRVAPRVQAFHGDADDRVPIDGARETVQQLTKNGFTATLVEYPGVRHSVSAQMRQDWKTALENAVQRATSP